MSHEAITLDIPEESLKVIDEIAANFGSDRQTVLLQAIKSYIEECEQLEVKADEAEQQIEAGNYLTQEQMEARVEAMARRSEAA